MVTNSSEPRQFVSTLRPRNALLEVVAHAAPPPRGLFTLVGERSDSLAADATAADRCKPRPSSGRKVAEAVSDEPSLYSPEACCSSSTSAHGATPSLA